MFVSWLLTLHLPLAALAAYWLARELGASRPGPSCRGRSTPSRGSRCPASTSTSSCRPSPSPRSWPVSCGARPSAEAGRCSPPRPSLALALSTLAVEFVAQAIVLGLALGLVAAPGRAGLARLALAVGLGVALAGLPIALTLGLLPETARGAGFTPDVALANAVHPAVLLQSLLPSLFGLPSAPAEAWWGGRFFSKGLPYFLSLYLGPLTLALAAVGTAALPRRVRPVLALLAALGLWYALGERGGLAPLVARLPLAGSFRFPSKALLLPHLAVAMAAGFAVERLRFGRAWGWLAAAGGLGGGGRGGPRGAAGRRPARSRRLDGRRPVLLADRRGGGAARGGCRAAARPGRGGGRVGGAPRDPPPRVGRRPGDGAGGGRPCAGRSRPQPAGGRLVLRSPAGNRRAAARRPRRRARLLVRPRPQPDVPRGARKGRARPHADGPLPAPADPRALRERDRPRRGGGGERPHRVRPEGARALPELYDPAPVGELLPWLRNAGVARVLSLDPLSHGELVPLAAVPAGPPGVAIHVYGVDTWPRASLACRATPVARREQALALPYRKGFDPWREVALERAGRRGAGRRPPDDLLQGPGAARVVDGERGTLRGRDQRERVPRGAGQPRAGVAGVRRRSARSPSSGRTASTARSR